MFSISKEFHFSASHQLLKLPADHPCHRLHGHNYIVVVELEAKELNPYGFVRDYRDLSIVKSYIDEKLDHRHLNDVFGTDMITAEYLAKTIFENFQKTLPEMVAVKVSETQKTWACYRPSHIGHKHA